MASVNTINNNSKISSEENKIEYLWVMGGASVLKSRTTRDIVGYLCYCEECKNKSVNGDGGIAFNTAEDLLFHRKMKAFECPGGCGFHICEEFGSITRHLDAYHKEMLTKLEKEGLDMSSRKRVWIYPDYANNNYTLNKPMPSFEASPLENAGAIIGGRIVCSMTPPKRVDVPPSPVSVPQSPTPEEARNIKGKKKFVPLEMHNENKVATPVPIRKTNNSSAKSWNKIENTNNVSFSQVMLEQKEHNSDNKIIVTKTVHYAQDDMRKETQCPSGKTCVKRDRPFACAFNHDGNGDIITRGTELTDEILCPYERPPFTRCGDGRCTKVHLENRVKFIEDKKTDYFRNVKQDTDNFSDKETGTSVITTSSQGTIIEMSHKKALAVANVLKQLNSTDDDSDDEDLNDNAVFAALSFRQNNANL